MLTLNDFSGGLNTKSSPRDIALNQVQSVTNAVLSNPGLIESSSTSTAKHTGNVSDLRHTKKGNGAFIFNSQFNLDASGTATQPTQAICFPNNKSDGNTTIQFFRRDFDSTGNFSYEGVDSEIDMGVTGGVEPVYYFVDGLLYVSDKLVVDGINSAEPKKLVYVDQTSRLGTGITGGWTDINSKIEIDGNQFEDISEESAFSTNPGSGEFSIILSTDPIVDATAFTTIKQNLVSPDNNLVTTTNPNDTNPDPTADIRLTDKVVYLKLRTSEDMSSADLNFAGVFSAGQIFDGYIIFINGEGMRVRSVSEVDLSVEGDKKILQLTVDRDVFETGLLEHGGSSEVKVSTSASISVTSGGWEAGSYEFCHTVVDLQDNETLPQAPQEDGSGNIKLFGITSGAYFTGVKVRIQDTSFTGRTNEKGFRVYTRKKDGNGRWILFLDVDYYKGVRKNLFEDYTTLVQAATDYHENSASFDIVNPSLDTYESINGYSQDEESIDFGTDGGFKAATVCARRAWVANVRKNNKVFDDRIYYSPVNRFSTFPDSYFLDIGISDGDSFTALHSLGNRLLAFKQKKLYVINVSSTSDAGWYLEAEYDGIGCRQQESVCKTPFGICWVNDDGVHIFDGTSMPKELSLFLDDRAWRANQLSNNPAIGYNNKYKQLNVVQDTTSGDNHAFVYDFQTQGWSFIQPFSSPDYNGMSNFLPSYDGLYYIEHDNGISLGPNAKVINLLTGDTGSKATTIITKDIDFGNPGLVKKVKKVYVTARDNSPGSTLTLRYALDGGTGFTQASDPAGGQATINNSQYEINAYTINQDCQSIALKLDSSGKIDINDITIDYRQTNKRAS
jgi:hypothetical protein